MRAVIYGRLEAGVFIRTKIAQYYDLAEPTAHELKLVLYDDAPPPTGDLHSLGAVGRVDYLTIEHGETQSKVPIQMYEPELRLEPFTVVLEVFAETNDGLQTHTLPAVNIRPIDVFRAEVTYVAAHKADFSDPTTSQYPTQAARYWHSVSDELYTENFYLTTILKHVRDLKDAPRNNKPLGRLNIVAHGSESTWWIRTDAATDPPPTPIVGFNAERMVALSDAAVPGGNVLDSESMVVIAACELGHNRALLEQIWERFGGLARIYAPKLDVVYRDMNGQPAECLGQVWRFYKPGSHEWPPATEIASRLESAFGASPNDSAPVMSRKAQYASFDTKDWEAVASIDESNINGPQIRFPPLVEEYRASVTAAKEFVFDGSTRKRDSELVKLVFAETKDPYALGLAYEVSVTPSVGKPDTYDVVAVGRKTMFKLLRLLTEDMRGGGAIVTPELSNPSHYGSFP